VAIAAQIDLEGRDRLTVARILRINHAGEHGAVRIYTAQLVVARRFMSDLTPFLEETLSHEQRHERMFLEAMPARGAKPCRLMFLWAFGGGLLGVGSALFGRWGVMACTAAVERTVHRHLDEQIAYLDGRDAALCDAIVDIRREELQHLDHAVRAHDAESVAARVFSSLIAAVTEVLIFATTRGESAAMARSVRKP
jgi:ubiquinone biosynthesis monooxygenase Coq7